MADPTYAQAAAERFVRLLAGNGTTTALVFGAHFPQAQNALFEAADASGLRIASGLVVSDRNLKPELEVSPETAYATSKELRDRWHGHGRLRYAVTPRFSVSCTGEMLDACQRAARATASLFTSHVNESPRRDRLRPPPLPRGTRLPGHVRARRPADRPLGAGAQRPRLRRRAQTPGDQPHRDRPLPVQQRLPGLRDLPDGAPCRRGRALRDGHRRRRGHRPEHAQGGAGRLPRADGPRPGPHARPRASCSTWPRRRERTRST